MEYLNLRGDIMDVFDVIFRTQMDMVEKWDKNGCPAMFIVFSLASNQT